MKRRKTCPGPDEANARRRARQQARQYDRTRYDGSQKEESPVLINMSGPPVLITTGLMICAD